VSFDQDFQRPIFIISAPRSGSTLLFETLAQARGLYTIGGESHQLIETIPELNIGSNNLESNCLFAEHAQPHVVKELRRRFMSVLRDRDGGPPKQRPVRMLEKTPKNALRIPFFKAAFPEAHFLVLMRDHRQTIGSMLDAWQSGRFRTYPRLPGWHLPSWSLLLTPGWRDLTGLTLPEIVVAQWEMTMRLMLDDLEQLPKDRWTLIHYDTFNNDWGGSVSQLARRLQLDWDKPLTGTLPNSRYTVTPPDPNKWRKHAAVLEPLFPKIQHTIDRAGRFGQS